MISLQDLNEGMTDCGCVLLVCPICRGELMLENPYRRLGRVRTGNLRCKEGCAVYPIVYGVPVMLLPGQPADWNKFYNWPWKSSIPRDKKQIMEAVAAGEFDKETKISGPSVTEKQLREVRRMMSKTRWEKRLHEGKIVIAAKGDRTSSTESNVMVIAERLRRIESGVVVDICCGGGFTTERVLQDIQPSVYSVSVDIDLLCAKCAGKRAELLGMSDRSIEICADARCLPFTDESLSAVYSRNGFNHIGRYVDVLKEAYRVLKTDGAFVVTERKSSMRHGALESIGLNYEERLEVLRHLGLFTHGQEFVKNVGQVGFALLNVDDLPESSYLLVDAIKN